MLSRISGTSMTGRRQKPRGALVGYCSGQSSIQETNRSLSPQPRPRARETIVEGRDRRSRFPYQSSWGKLRFDDSLGTHHKGDLNVDCTANFSLVGLVDCDPCYFHQLHRSGRSNHPVSFDGRSGSWHAPLECETIAFSRNSPC